MKKKLLCILAFAIAVPVGLKAQLTTNSDPQFSDFLGAHDPNFSFDLGNTYTGMPFPAVVPTIPGDTIYAWKFDKGGQSISWYSLEATFKGDAKTLRSDKNLNMAISKFPGGLNSPYAKAGGIGPDNAYQVGYFHSGSQSDPQGSWVRYTFNVAVEDDYRFRLWYAMGDLGHPKSLKFWFDEVTGTPGAYIVSKYDTSFVTGIDQDAGKNADPTLAYTPTDPDPTNLFVPRFNGWGDGDDTLTPYKVHLTAGTHVLTVENWGRTDFNLVRFLFLPASTVGVASAVSNPLNLSIYPNPASDKLTVEFANSSEVSTIVVTDMTGKELIRQVTSNNTTVPTSGLQNGVYFISVKNSKGTSTSKFVKN